jgi:hypothetical protein
MVKSAAISGSQTLSTSGYRFNRKNVPYRCPNIGYTGPHITDYELRESIMNHGGQIACVYFYLLHGALTRS